MNWQTLTSVADVCAAYPDRMRGLLAALNLRRPGLAGVKAAADRGDLEIACAALLAYYQGRETVEWLSEDAARGDAGRGRAILDDTFTFQEVTGRVPRTADGRLDWACTGPRDDLEWAWALNRHYHIADLLVAYQQGGDVRYASAIDAHVRDWIISSLPYPGVKSSTAMWRGLEVSHRVKTWSCLFFPPRPGPQPPTSGPVVLAPATRLLVLSSLPEHAHYLRGFHARRNWATMELSSLALIGAAWPEFKESAAWFRYAKARLAAEIAEQVYDDGVQDELTYHYHRGALHNFEQASHIFAAANAKLPRGYARRLEAMWNYVAYALKPDGFGPLNNDSDLDYNRERVIEAAARDGRPDWVYVATNGREGAAPADPPSRIFPWAGQLIMRSGWDAGAQWAFFDAGPWGTGHQHNDKLHLSIFAGGRDLLVDSGRFAYRGALADRFRRPYALHSAAHNVILIDGQGQYPGPLLAERGLDASEARVTPAYDYARGSFDRFEDVAGVVRHTRAVMYLRGRFWVVVDRIETDRPRRIEALWHWHPRCTVQADGLSVESTDEDAANLRIIPAGPAAWDVAIVKGQESPRLQGWYSERYNLAEPAPVAVYTADLVGSATFAWVLLPRQGRAPVHAVEVVARDDHAAVLRVGEPGSPAVEIHVPLTKTHSPNIKQL